MSEPILVTIKKLAHQYKDEFIEARIQVEFGPSDFEATVHKGVVL